MPSPNDRTRQWARIGAKARLAEIEQERAAILQEFPDLRSSSERVDPSRRQLSPAARKKLSEGMRRYWAKHKAKG